MIFSKEKFKQNADRATKKALSSHIDALDGKPVIDGQIDYEIDGVEWYLYPVMLEWCSEN